ncbi:MAG: S41 family peptidase [Prolixibacteraceae bacterium]|nr:S41 family peptidase [Prolixibacteraceae bacterium]
MIKKTVLVVVMIVMQIYMIFPFSQAQSQALEKSVIKYGRLLQLVNSCYVDTVNLDKLTEDAIVGVLSNLDPHSVYISKEEVAKMNEPLVGSFDGIGISFNILRDTLLVVTTIPGGPSEKVGLMPGDRIIFVDGKNIAGVNLQNSDVLKMLRGKKGTTVKLKVYRRGGKELLDFNIIRDKIPINSLDASYMLDDQTGYVKLNRFSATTVDEFTDALSELYENPGFKNLILDLRENGGGYLKAAIGVANQFLKSGKLVVYTQGVHDSRHDYRSSFRGDFEDGRLIILTDEYSASASEIVSGAVQDWDRGLIVGRRSFGKGLVQQPFELNDGSVIRLTTAHYYTPSGRCIQKPYDDGIAAYNNDYINRFKDGELFSKDSVHLDKSKSFKTLISHRTVYAGGGIMPDIFVPMDTSFHYQYFNLLNHKNIPYSAMLDYLNIHRKQLQKKYADFESFKLNYHVGDDLINKIIADGVKEGIKGDEENVSFAKPLIKRLIKSIMARDLYEPSCYYQIANEEDESIKKAISIIEDKDSYDKYLKGQSPIK